MNEPMKQKVWRRAQKSATFVKFDFEYSNIANI